MKIKSLKIHNFMRYKDDNELHFSTDNEKNVTVVLGDNTFGKTTLAQAFRWGLYENLNDTNYIKKRDVILLNNEAAAEMRDSQMKDVYVEIIVINDNEEIKFVRKISFNRRSGNPNDLSVKQIGDSKLTMQIKENGIWGNVISNAGNNVDPKKYKPGCVQEAIDNMFPQNLSNYFFFDGERWNDLKSKTNDIKNSVDTILGISGLTEMMNHLKDNRINVVKRLRDRIKGTSGEYERIKREIKELEDSIIEYKKEIESIQGAIDTTERTYESTLKTLNDNRKIEEDQKELSILEGDIGRYEEFKAGYYADIVKELSNSAKFFAAMLLPEFLDMLKNIELEGRDIPGVTVDTIDYLLEIGECLCGTKLTRDSKAYEAIMKLRKQVPPEMLGGAVGKLKVTLEAWVNETNELKSTIIDKAKAYDVAQDTIDDKTKRRDKLVKTIDRKTNLGPVRLQNKQAKERLVSLRNKKTEYKLKSEQFEDIKLKKLEQLDAIAIHDKQNEQIYRCLTYVEALYEKASSLANQRKNTIITDLNEIIGRNFQRMFNDHEKYARLGSDYKIHVYYHKVGDLVNYEEENLSNGETIAINFVFIVSILELAKQYRELEKNDEEYGMEDAILGLPLVLDGPFSALSNENTTLVANHLPQFAEQVIIFMLDKDWDSSGLEKYTLPEYCYRVNKDPVSNSSFLEHI